MAENQLISSAIDWARTQSQRVLEAGVSLDPHQIDIARRVGVAHPERIRLLRTTLFPRPDDRNLRAAADQLGLLGPNSIGLAFGYSVLVHARHISDRLLAHEFRHVQQFEQSGSLETYLERYLESILAAGYLASAFERDARAAEEMIAFAESVYSKTVPEGSVVLTSAISGPCQ